MCENEIEFTLTHLKEAQPDCNNIDSLHFFSVEIKEAEIRPFGGRGRPFSWVAAWAHGKSYYRVLYGISLASLSRHRNWRSVIRNAGSAGETRLKDGSEWGANCSANNFNIVKRHIFSESSMSRPLKIEGDSRGTATIFLEIFDFERVGGRWLGRPYRGQR